VLDLDSIIAREPIAGFEVVGASGLALLRRKS